MEFRNGNILGGDGKGTIDSLKHVFYSFIHYGQNKNFCEDKKLFNK